jgi:hypothetical protein
LVFFIFILLQHVALIPGSVVAANAQNLKQNAKTGKTALKLVLSQLFSVFTVLERFSLSLCFVSSFARLQLPQNQEYCDYY